MLLFSLLAGLQPAQTQTPGGVAGAALWLKADAGAAPAQWSDQSGNNFHFPQADGARQPTIASNEINFNPSVSFDGVNDNLSRRMPFFDVADVTNNTLLVVRRAVGAESVIVGGEDIPTPGSSAYRMVVNRFDFVTDSNDAAFYTAPSPGDVLLTTGLTNATDNIIRVDGLQVDSQTRTVANLSNINHRFARLTRSPRPLTCKGRPPHLSCLAP